MEKKIMPKTRARETEKILHKIIEFILEANEVSFNVDFGIFEMPNQPGYVESGYNGRTTITFELYHKNRNQTEEVVKRACSNKYKLRTNKGE